jgi:hypothetical protein
MAHPRKQSCIDNHGPSPERTKAGGCKLCHREYKRQRRADGLAGPRRRGRRAQQRQRSRARKRIALAEYRRARSCARCGAADSLHFHHRDPATKVADVSRMVDHDRGWDALWTEVAKCDVLCATCHIEHHHPGDDAGDRSGSTEQRPTTIDKHDPLYASVALDVLIDGHVSRYNAQRLHSRGLKVEDLDHRGFAEAEAAVSTMLNQPAGGTSC